MPGIRDDLNVRNSRTVAQKLEGPALQHVVHTERTPARVRFRRQPCRPTGISLPAQPVWDGWQERSEYMM